MLLVTGGYIEFMFTVSLLAVVGVVMVFWKRGFVFGFFATVLTTLVWLVLAVVSYVFVFSVSELDNSRLLPRHLRPIPITQPTRYS